MKQIIEASQLPEDEKVYLAKDFLGWRVVEPWRDIETGKINWFNFIFGGKRALFILLFLILLAALFYMTFQEQLINYKHIMENPCAYCNSTAKTLFTGG